MISDEDIIKMLGGFARIKRVEKSPSLISENPIQLVLQDHFMNIGNLEVLIGRGFKFMGCGVNEDGDLYLSVDVQLPKSKVDIEK